MKPSPIRIAALVLATMLSLRASADIYRWVDERGVTNYSSVAPAELKAANKVALVPDRVSVYTPDKALTEAVAAFRQQINSPRPRVPETQVVQPRVPVIPPDPCLDSRDVNCYGGAGAYYPYLPVATVVARRHGLVAGPFHHHPHHMSHSR